MYSNIEFLITLFVILSLPSPSNLFSSIYSSIFVTSVLDYTMTSPQAFIFRAGEKKIDSESCRDHNSKRGAGWGGLLFCGFLSCIEFSNFQTKDVSIYINIV